MNIIEGMSKFYDWDYPIRRVLEVGTVDENLEYEAIRELTRRGWTVIVDPSRMDMKLSPPHGRRIEYSIAIRRALGHSARGGHGFTLDIACKIETYLPSPEVALTIAIQGHLDRNKPAIG